MAKAKKKTQGDAAVTRPAQASSARARDERKQAIRKLEDDLREHDAGLAREAIGRAAKWISLLGFLEPLLDDVDWVEGRENRDVFPPRDRDYYSRDLDLAAQRATKRDFGSTYRRAILATKRRIVEGMMEAQWITKPHSFNTYWHNGDTPEETIRELQLAIEAIRGLLADDRALAHKAGGFRTPAEQEAAVLGVLLRADRGLVGEEIASQLKKSEWLIDAKGVSDAIGRLREECGYRIPNDGKTGYRVDSVDRDLARHHGVSVGTDGTQP
jgi:biotin operon repressor